MKSFRNANLFTTTVVMLFFFSVIGFWGCEKDNLFENQYAEYLDLDSYELSLMSGKDMETIGQAIQRLGISKKNGLYHIKQRTGKQSNMSEDLYNFVTGGFEHTNRISRPKSLNNLIPRLKSGNPEGNNSQSSDTTYCVAHALEGMGGTSFLSVKAHMDSLGYSNGVPQAALDSIVYHFYPNARKYNSSTNSGPLNNAFIWYRTSDSTGHAVNGLQQWGDAIMYYDNQNQRQGFITTDSLKTIYYPW